MRPAEVFHELVHGISDGRFDDVLRLYAEDTHVEHPFDPHRSPPLRSRAELAEHFKPIAAAEPTRRREPVDITVHETADAEVVVVEFAYRVTDSGSGEVHRVPCVFILRVRDGQIVASRDYIDHLASARAWGRSLPSANSGS